MNLLIANAEVAGAPTDVRIASGRVVAVGERLSPEPDDMTFDAGGGALLPGLHDHHLHLHAIAAAASSVSCGPPEVVDRAGLAAALNAADAALGPGDWIRGIGYHESVAGAIDRTDLDVVTSGRPLRIQHRSGGLWVLNSAALAELGLRSGQTLPSGVESDGGGRPTGRLWRADGLFRVDATPPPLAPIGQQLLALGITGITDATPSLDRAALTSLADARRDGSLPQRLIALGAPNGWSDRLVETGPWKLLLHDHDLPSMDGLIAMIRDARQADRAVAVHCVTRTSLVLTLAALESVGTVDGDRIEHASVVPPELVGALRSLGLRVVTQPSFIRDRGDEYTASVDADDMTCLYPYASLIEAGVPVTGSSDAPFGDIDPWRTIAAAVERTSLTGAVIGGSERVTARQALAGYLSDPSAPGGAPRRIVVGAPADVCVLAVPLAVALENPGAEHVAMVVSGDALYDATRAIG